MAFLGVKLGCKHVALGDGCTSLEAVVEGPCHTVRPRRRQEKAVYEVEIGVVRNSVPKRVALGLRHLIPAHMRNLQLCSIGVAVLVGETGDRSIEKGQAIDAAIFFRSRHERLHANADSQYGCATFDS